LPPVVATADNAAMEDEPSSSTPPKRKRRWYQFSLRTLLIEIVVLAVGFGWLGRNVERKRQQRDAVAAIVKMGGTTDYYY